MNSAELKKVFYWATGINDKRGKKINSIQAIKDGITNTKVYRGAYKEKSIIVTAYDKENNQIVGEVSGYYRFSFKIKRTGSKYIGIELEGLNKRTSKGVMSEILKWTYREPVTRNNFDKEKLKNKVDSQKRKTIKKQNRGYYVVKRLTGLTLRRSRYNFTRAINKKIFHKRFREFCEERNLYCKYS